MNAAGSIRWRNGFFRIWLLVASVWLIGISALTPPWTAWSDYKEAEAQLERYSAAFQKVEAGIAAGGRTNEDGKFVDVARLTSIRDGLEIHKPDLDASFVISKAHATSVTLSLVLPPLILLVFGVAVGWVLNGFKRHASNQDMER